MSLGIFFIVGGGGLHGELEGDFDSPGGGGGVEVGEAADVVDAHEFDDVLDADAVFRSRGCSEGGALCRICNPTQIIIRICNPH